MVIAVIRSDAGRAGTEAPGLSISQQQAVFFNLLSSLTSLLSSKWPRALAVSQFSSVIFLDPSRMEGAEFLVPPSQWPQGAQ